MTLAAPLPAIFDALSDPTRLAIVEKLLQEGELAGEAGKVVLDWT